MVALDVEAVSRMSPGRFFRDHASAVNALDFHHTEDALVTTGDDDAIHLYNTNTGVKTKTLYSKVRVFERVLHAQRGGGDLLVPEQGRGRKGDRRPRVRYHSLSQHVPAVFQRDTRTR